MTVGRRWVATPFLAALALCLAVLGAAPTTGGLHVDRVHVGVEHVSLPSTGAVRQVIHEPTAPGLLLAVVGVPLALLGLRRLRTVQVTGSSLHLGVLRATRSVRAPPHLS